MRPTREIEGFLQGIDARALIERFDVEFDIPGKRHVCLGLLEALGAFDAEDHAVRAGAWWGRIVHHDVAYRLLHGLECIEDSKHDAEMLAKEVEEGKRTDPFDAYVAARWHDGAGRIHFRCGDMMAAREHFAEAAAIAERAALWYCRPDIQSNRLRAAFDEREKAGEKKNLPEEKDGFEALLGATEALAAEHQVPISEVEGAFRPALERAIEAGMPEGSLSPGAVVGLLGPGDEDGRRRRRELLRGLSNVLHNLSIVSKPDRARDWLGDKERSRELSLRSAILSFALGDGYRLAQALRHGATVAKSGDDAKRLLTLVKDRLPWERGKWMATQRLADLAGRDGVGMIDALLVELERRRATRGGDIGFDVDIYRYTVDVLAKISSDPERVRVKRLESTRSVRRVVKVSTYRQRYAELIFPVYLNEIRRARGEVLGAPGESRAAGLELWEALLALVEEASARELLDLLEANRGAAAVEAPRAPMRSGEAPVIGPGGALRERPSAAHEDVRGSRVAYEAIAAERRVFEERALHRPILAAPHDPDIAQALRRSTAREPGLAIVRYFLHGYEERRGDDDHKTILERVTGLSAMVFRHGHAVRSPGGCVVHDIGHEAIRALAAEPHVAGPSAGRARRLWEVAIQPIWSALCEGGLPEHLVLIPTTGMFGLPLHTALVPGATPGAPELPLGALLPLSFSVSATAFATRRRHLLRTQPVDPDDDLCALVPDDDLYPGELVGVDWNDPRHFHVAGARPDGLRPEEFTWWGEGDLPGLQCLLAHDAELFVYAGHGTSSMQGGESEVALELANGQYLTQYHLAGEFAFRRSKWAILGACVSGQAADTASGEVAGFLRAFMAANVGALGVTLWKVRNDAIAHAAREILRRVASRKQLARKGASDPADLNLDIVAELSKIQAAAFHRALDRRNVPIDPEGGSRTVEAEAGGESAATPLDDALHACPLALYL